MARTTKKQVEAKFERFINSIGGRIAKDYKDVGGYQLDNQPIYGGYVIQRIFNDSGAIDHPFGQIRRKASEFYDTLDFAERTHDLEAKFERFTNSIDYYKEKDKGE